MEKMTEQLRKRRMDTEQNLPSCPLDCKPEKRDYPPPSAQESLQHSSSERGQNRGPKKIEWSLYSVKKILLDTILPVRHF